MSDQPPVKFDKENPEWTEKDFARTRPVGEFPKLAAAFPRTRGTQHAPTKQQVTLRLDRDIVARFRATGPGWQARINDALRTISL